MKLPAQPPIFGAITAAAIFQYCCCAILSLIFLFAVCCCCCCRRPSVGVVVFVAIVGGGRAETAWLSCFIAAAGCCWLLLNPNSCSRPCEVRPQFVLNFYWPKEWLRYGLCVSGSPTKHKKTQLAVAIAKTRTHRALCSNTCRVRNYFSSVR